MPSTATPDARMSLTTKPTDGVAHTLVASTTAAIAKIDVHLPNLSERLH
jgi:hypothetical protein